MSSSRTCIYCGRQVPVTRRKYCSDRCCEKASAKKRTGHKQDIDHKRLQRQIKKHQESGAKLSQINQAARDSRMTYGQFVSRMYAPTIERRRKEGEK